MAGAMSHDANIDSATERVLAGIENEELAARYPDRAHFISADNPHQGEMAARALFEGDPVVIVYPDGHELLVQPEPARGFARWSRAAAALLFRFRRFDQGTVQLPLAPISRLAIRVATRSQRNPSRRGEHSSRGHLHGGRKLGPEIGPRLHRSQPNSLDPIRSIGPDSPLWTGSGATHNPSVAGSSPASMGFVRLQSGLRR